MLPRRTRNANRDEMMDFISQMLDKASVFLKEILFRQRINRFINHILLLLPAIFRKFFYVLTYIKLKCNQSVLENE